MSKPHQHDDLPPFAEFIPHGRTAIDAAAYRLLRRITRVHRHELWAATTQCWLDMTATGTGYIWVKWRP